MRPDLLHVENLIKAIKKATFKDFDALEGFALTAAYKWLHEHKARLEQELKLPQPPLPPNVKPLKNRKKK